MAHSKEMKKWEDAIWQFIEEHSKPSTDRDGKPCMLVIFKTDGRQDLFNRIRGRWRYGYVRPFSKREERHVDRLHDRTNGNTLRHKRERLIDDDYAE